MLKIRGYSQIKQSTAQRAVAKELMKWRNVPDTDWDHTAERTGTTKTHHKLFERKSTAIKLYLDNMGTSAAKLAEGIPDCVKTLHLCCSFIYLF